ncbi:phosphogluconate dehydrogenase (NAD(+)-dependent, decarboxylating) [Streptomyces sp. TRM68367]|uniref:phosphogluconate dehydrogenase (NAD(+)-dependent, decarboxylating) n=1 Tax=Streptomyces sp. TRM68367 TaxID=2758415 RepID=UPI00165A99B4|nr:decarboxylating 6-phosphogluconate dehydrogenase [Streptomyces sp. TRM68367]MBC9727244.1 decarboxylating 6-phosphogluconate dehydrogenase [Streptomyces sp. TRM68367]
MQVGIVGLGRMGGNMAARWRDAGHEVLGYSRTSPDRDVTSLEEMAEKLAAPRVVWLMLPAGEPTRQALRDLAGLLSPGDVVVEGGNSRFSDDPQHARLLAEHGIGYVDCGVSGGVWGRENGYAVMCGGEDEHVRKVWPLLQSLAPEEDGLVHAGPVGAGHYAKMVHNGIEYGMMQALAEGYELLEACEYVPDVPKVLASWRHGTVVRSWLLDLQVRALEEDPELAALSGRVDDSGEGRWTVEEAVRLAVCAPAMTAALYARFASRKPDAAQLKALAAMRQQFGGHAVHAAPAPAGQG